MRSLSGHFTFTPFLARGAHAHSQQHECPRLVRTNGYNGQKAPLRRSPPLAKNRPKSVYRARHLLLVRLRGYHCTYSLYTIARTRVYGPSSSSVVVVFYVMAMPDSAIPSPILTQGLCFVCLDVAAVVVAVYIWLCSSARLKSFYHVRVKAARIFLLPSLLGISKVRGGGGAHAQFFAP